MAKNETRVLDDLIRWLCSPLAAHPLPGLYTTRPLPNGRVIQQDLRELEAYLSVLSELDTRGITVEIGLGSGGTHFVWSQLFDEVLSVDSDYLSCCRAAIEFPDPSSQFIAGDSDDPRTVYMLNKVLEGRLIDHLFIDGDHRYEAVRADFETYAPFVRVGGIIGLHDAEWERAEVRVFLSDLKGGKIKGWPATDFEVIRRGPGRFATGIAYFAVPATRSC